jgi:hypothetical protein
VSVLPVTLDNVKLLCGFVDTTQDAGVTALIALQQPALEYALDPAILTNSGVDTGLSALLTLGVSEALGGDYLASLGRTITTTGLLTAQTLNTAINTLETDNAGATQFVQQTFKLGNLEVATRPLFDNFRPEVTRSDLVKIGFDLAARGAARLKPFLRSERSLARSAAGGDNLLDDQTGAQLVLGANMGSPGNQPGTGQTLGPPPDNDFDRVLGTDGHTEPPGLDDFSPGMYNSGWNGGSE